MKDFGQTNQDAHRRGWGESSSVFELCLSLKVTIETEVSNMTDIRETYLLIREMLYSQFCVNVTKVGILWEQETPVNKTPLLDGPIGKSIGDILS